MYHYDLAVGFNKVTFPRGGKCIYKNLSFIIPKDKITATPGPPGIGKKTPLHLIKVNSSEMRVLGNDLT